jgi:hypothetical protein
LGRQEEMLARPVEKKAIELQLCHQNLEALEIRHRRLEGWVALISTGRRAAGNETLKNVKYLFGMSS